MCKQNHDKQMHDMFNVEFLFIFFLFFLGYPWHKNAYSSFQCILFTLKLNFNSFKFFTLTVLGQKCLQATERAGISIFCKELKSVMFFFFIF